MDAAALREDAQSVVLTLTTIGKTLATAESCTGGLLGALLTDIPGASNVYLGGVVTYAYSAKEALLGVDAAVLERDGAVCETVARQMAEGIRKSLTPITASALPETPGPPAIRRTQMWVRSLSPARRPPARAVCGWSCRAIARRTVRPPAPLRCICSCQS